MSQYRRDFTQGSIYFFTVVISNRTSGILVKYINHFRAAYQETLRFHPFKTVAICILPDHFHLIMALPEHTHDYSRRIASIKRNFSLRLKQTDIWQKRFWEHKIRDQKDLYNHMDYIYYNPVKHGHVSAVKDWPYSSFHRDVQNGLYPLDWGGNIEIAQTWHLE